MSSSAVRSALVIILRYSGFRALESALHDQHMAGQICARLGITQIFRICDFGPQAVSLDQVFSGLRPSDFLYISAHGSPAGLTLDKTISYIDIIRVVRPRLAIIDACFVGDIFAGQPYDLLEHICVCFSASSSSKPATSTFLGSSFTVWLVNNLPACSSSISDLRALLENRAPVWVSRAQPAICANVDDSRAIIPLL